MRANGEERRRYPRSRRAVPQIVQDDGPGVLNHVDNISANGVLCHTVKPIPLMTKMSIALDLPKPENRRIECEGVVVRCEPHEVGDDHFKVAILYTKIDEADQRAIEELVAQDLEEDALE
ncbi:MAG: PilZ domain-containing protein [Candidatus Hydrogenedentota bacterium]